MQFKIDECLPVEIADILTEKGFKSETVKDEGLAGSPDKVIWETVQAENRFLITADLDFSDTRLFRPGTHPGILLLRLSKEGKRYILSYFRQLTDSYDLNDWTGCMVVATDHKVRVKRPL